MAYAEKFKGFIEAIHKAKTDGAEAIIIPSPQTIGDNYEEIIESLNRVAVAGLSLSIVPPNERVQPDYSRN